MDSQKQRKILNFNEKIVFHCNAQCVCYVCLFELDFNERKMQNSLVWQTSMKTNLVFECLVMCFNNKKKFRVKHNCFFDIHIEWPELSAFSFYLSTSAKTKEEQTENGNLFLCERKILNE